MRVGIDLQGTQTGGSRKRGIGRYVQAVLEGLLSRSGRIEYRLFSHAGLPEPDVSLPPTVPVTALSFPADVSAGELLYRSAVLAQQPDVMFLPSPIEMIDAVLPDFASFPGRVYAICYDLIPLIFADRYLTEPSVRDTYHRCLRNLRHADCVLAISESTRQDVIRHLAVPPEKVVNISSGAPTFFKPVQEEERASWRAELGQRFGIVRPFVLYTGGEDWRKNIGGLIDGYALLPASVRRSHQLVVACRMSEQGVREFREQAGGKGLAGDDLVFTNFVSDDQMRALYSLCRLFVFPSLYEGFGLPLVEAMACGAPAVAANNSSLREIVTSDAQLFDGRSPESVADCLQKHLENESLLSALAARAPGLAGEFTWTRVVDRVAAALEEVRSPTAGGRESFSLSRPGLLGTDEYSPYRDSLSRLAMFGPLPPLTSGIADYTAELLPVLSRHFDLDLYVEDVREAAVNEWVATTETASRVFRESTFTRNLERIGVPYRAALCQLGNSPFHCGGFAAMARYGMITVLHDYNLCGLIENMGTFLPGAGITLSGELEYSYGKERAAELLGWLSSEGVGSSELARRGVYANRRVFRRSLGVIVHNRWAYDKAVAEWGRDCEFVTRIPHLIAPVPEANPGDREHFRAKWDIPQEAFVFASCGFLVETKRPRHILDAFQQHLGSHPNSLLLFVGEDMLKPSLTTEIERRGLADRVRLAGYVTEAAFGEALALSDVCLSLRYPTNGETSGALLRALARGGAACVVTDIGSFAELPDNIVHKIPPPDRGDEVAELVRAMSLLADDPQYRRRLAAEGRRFVTTECSPERCARLYAEFIEAVMAHPRTRQRLLADYVGREAARAKVDLNAFGAEPFLSAILGGMGK